MEVTNLVLLVEDNGLCAKYFKLLLEDAVGCKVHWAKDGVAALQFLATNKPGLIHMDIQLPELSGWETIKVIASRPELEGVPICVVTACGLMFPKLIGPERKRVAEEMEKPVNALSYVRMIYRWLYGIEDTASIAAGGLGPLMRPMTNREDRLTLH